MMWKKSWIALLCIGFTILLVDDILAHTDQNRRPRRRRWPWNGPEIGSLIKNFELPTLDGKTFKLSDHRGIVHRDPGRIAKYKTNWPFMHKDCGPCHHGEFSQRFQVEVTSLEDKKNCTICHPTYQPPPE